MKKIFLIALCLATLSLASNAQTPKFGHINATELVQLMEDFDTARIQLNKYQNELVEEMEAMQTEYNNKLNTYQQKQATWTDAIKQQKEAELSEIVGRLQQFEQTASNDLNNMQNTLMAPIYEKATAAIEKVAKANGLIYVFDLSAGSLIYFDAAQSKDLLPDAKKELGIPAEKVSPTQIPATTSAE